MSTVLKIADDSDEQDAFRKPEVPQEVFTWREFRRDVFWQKIPNWQTVDEETFRDYLWQEKRTQEPKAPRSLVGFACHSWQLIILQLQNSVS